MNTETELHGKFQIMYRLSSRGCTIASIERIDKYTDLHESGENRFDLKVQIEDNTDGVVDFVYRQKLYISREEAKELVYELL